jgi:hypothetical protein
MDYNHSVLEIEKGVSFGAASGTIIEITKKAIEPDAMPKGARSSLPYAIWGSNNNKPQEIIDTTKQETTSLGALQFKIAAHFGKGLYFYRESVKGDTEVKTPVPISELIPDMQEFWYNNDIPSFQFMNVLNYEWFNWFPVQYLPNANYNKIVRVSAKRTKDTRIGKRDVRKGEVPNFFLSALWPKPNEFEMATVPAFDRNYPFEVANGIYKHEAQDISNDYYPTASWLSALRWMEVAMKIPRWINANIDNSINIKYHVEIPEQYFIDLYPEKNYDSKEKTLAARKAAEADIKAEVDKCLAGSDNAQKIFYTKFAVDMNGQPRPGWKINVLTNNIQDSAWLNADATAAARISSAHNVDASLTALVTGSNLNVGSGSDAREKFNIHMQLKTMLPRQKTLEWYDIVQRANRWPMDIKLGYRDLTLETLSVAKQGFQAQHEPNPTAF